MKKCIDDKIREKTASQNNSVSYSPKIIFSDSRHILTTENYEGDELNEENEEGGNANGEGGDENEEGSQYNEREALVQPQNKVSPHKFKIDTIEENNENMSCTNNSIMGK